MKNALILAAWGILACGIEVPAFGQTIGKPAQDVRFTSEGGGGGSNQDWFLVEEHQGRLVVMYFWRTSNLDSVNTLGRMQQLQTRYRPRGVRFIDFVPEKKEDVEKLVNERGLTLLENHIYERGVKNLQMLYGAMSEPYAVILDSRGIIRWRGHPDDRLEERIDFFLKRHPPPAGDQALLASMLNMAEGMIAAGEPGKAWTVAHRVETYTSGDDGGPLHTRAGTVKTNAENKAREWLNEAIELEKQREYEKAARIVAEISVRFDKGRRRANEQQSGQNQEDDQVQIKRDAEQEIGRMNGVRDLKEAIRDALKDARAEVLLDDAAALEQHGSYEVAIQLYETVIENFKDTKSERAAKAALTRIERDAQAQKAIAEARKIRRGDQLFAIAEHFARVEMFEEAREQFERFLADYPNHEQSEWARDALKKLPAASAQR